jgi:acetyl-CoA carboxylase biotin carboxyl carrier protein
MQKPQKKSPVSSEKGSSVFTLEGLKEFIGFFNKVDISEVEIREGDKSIMLSKYGKSASVPQFVPSSAPVTLPAAPIPQVQAAAQPPAAPSSVPVAAPSNLVEIKSPIVGTFYTSSDPKLPPFVTVGSEIGVGKTICIIEAMKVFNEIKAEISGVVKEVCVKNEQPVEFGQVLFRVEAK